MVMRGMERSLSRYKGNTKRLSFSTRESDENAESPPS
jgi:hypothetical protein